MKCILALFNIDPTEKQASMTNFTVVFACYLSRVIKTTVNDPLVCSNTGIILPRVKALQIYDPLFDI